MSSVGIIGGGQLGLMLGEAGRKIGVDCVFLDPASDPPARRVGPVIRCAFEDPEGLRELAARVDRVTYEFENLTVDAIDALATRVPVCPPTAALRYGQDRLDEKNLFQKLDIPTPEFRAVETRKDLEAAVDTLGLPLIVKTRRLGYDGKGHFRLRSAEEAGAAMQAIGDVPLIAEQLIDFDCEVSVFGARDRNGDIALYPLTENLHRQGILRISLAPAGVPEIDATAAGYLQRLLGHLDYVGVLALELFVVNGRLLANEFAPRVHNSGHWTIEGAVTSQFENHLRAILGMPLGKTSAKGYAAMVNLIGELPRDRRAVGDAGYRLHDYGKLARPDRKLGHITLVANSAESRDRQLQRLQRMLACDPANIGVPVPAERPV